MNRIPIVMALLIMLGSCHQKLLKVKEVDAIRVTIMTKRQHGKVYEITGKQQVDALVAITEKAQRDPEQFKSSYKLEFISNGSVETMMVKGYRVKVDGLSYVLEENLGQRVAAAIKGEKEEEE